MRIFIAGLGLIGASLAKALGTTYKVDGSDIDSRTVDTALKNGIIKEHTQEIDGYDFVIVALPPKAAIEFINNTRFKDNAIVTDICGVKKAIFEQINITNFNYIGAHPMAGKEKWGIENSSADLFKGANLILTVNDKTDAKSLKTAEKVYKTAGFSRVIKCSEDDHDRIIAYTSQLAHIVSSAYVKSLSFSDYDGFTGGSFQDMTRIAGMNEKIWTQLFMMNRYNLINELKTLTQNLDGYIDALENSDETLLSRLITEGADIKNNTKIDK